MSDAKLILPPCDFGDDEELLDWLEACRLINIKAGDELEEASAYVYAKLRRYAMEQGMDSWPASRTAKAVSTPIARAGGSHTRAASWLRLAGRRFEAYVEAVERPRRRQSDFQIKGARR